MWKINTDRGKLHPAQQLAILAFSAFYFIPWFVEPPSKIDWPIESGAFALFLLIYFVAFNFRKWTLPCAAAMVALSFFISPYNSGANVFAIYACSFFAYYQPPRRALLLIALTLLTLLMATLIHKLHMLFYFGISAVVIFGLSFSGIIDRQRIQHQQRELHSQNEIQRLAKVAERERIGQDLHDVLGHNLTGIHLKAQLAVKRLEQGDHGAAKEQCLAVAKLAYSALREIRETLADIKKQSLTEELLAQKAFLESLGIDFDYQMPVCAIPPTVESDLLYIVRELITNTLRHAQAKSAHLNLTVDQQCLILNYHDNGKGMASIEESAFGNGLQGIRQRIIQRQGHVSLYNNKGLHTVVSIPQLQSNDL